MKRVISFVPAAAKSKEISAYFLKKNLVKPSEEPSISRFAKSKGRLPNARKQIRY